MWWVFVWMVVMTSTKAIEIKDQPDAEVEFIRAEEMKFQVGPEKEAVVLVGDSLVGKSTLSLLLTDGEMEAEPWSSESSLYHFVDKNGRICNKLEHKFTFPIIDTFNGTTYYDWSGFRYNTHRGSYDPKYEVLTSQLFKKFAKSGKSAKFVFVIDESLFDITSHTRVDRAPEWLSGKFIEFADQAKDLFKNITKYREAIGFVVTKSISELGEDDEDEKNSKDSATDYLRQLRNGLTDWLQKGDERGYNLTKLISFVDVLLEKSGDKYKIGVFKQPLEEGPVKMLTVQQNEKNAIRSMINNNLRFVETDPNDFGYAVTYETREKESFRKWVQQLD